MANKVLTLFRGAATTSSSDLYTTPDSTTTLITSVMVVNDTSANQTYILEFDGVLAAPGATVGPYDAIMFEPKQSLESGKIIAGQASSTSVYFHITGLEMS